MENFEQQFKAMKPENGEPQKEVTEELKQQTLETESAPMQEDEISVSYLGVRLPKAENQEGGYVPQREKYQDYINDRFSMELQKKIAISFLQGDPILVEGGTSIGKTTTVKKMAADLGWEVHYANLNGATDVEDLMGRYIPNPQKTSPDDPEYIFADGKVTSGLRQEDGKIKVIILDELNAAAPNILIRLHEVLDALERDGDIVLSEDASETISVNKGQTKVISLMNPPGKGYFGREPLDPAQLRRWVYQKEATDLPEDTFSHSTDVLFSLASKTEEISEEMFLTSQEQALSQEQLAEIPGIGEILEKYKEFHKAAKEMLAQRKLAEDQPQVFSYDDRTEPRRVRDFVLRFYNGDINETFQNALRYYYLNKLEGEEDKQKLEELILNVKYTPKKEESKRRGLEDEKTEVRSKEKLGTKLEGSPKEQMETALELMGKENFFGPQEVEKAFGIQIESIPNIPFSKEELERARELGQTLILRTDKAQDGAPLTMQKMNEILKDKFQEESKGKVLCSETGWKEKEDFFTKETPNLSWVLTTKNILGEGKEGEEYKTTGKNYLEQTETIADYLKNQVFKDQELPKEYQEAIDEFESKKDEIQRLIETDWQKAAGMLENLKITKLTRQSPVEAIYDILINFQNNDERVLENKYTWTIRRASVGRFVSVGNFSSDGASVVRNWPDYSRGSLGVSFSRS